MSTTCDVAILGLGAMGSAAAYHLAKRGRRVLGLDRFKPPHTLGSSHGQTRIIREAYFEHPLYVPLVRRAYELWMELDRIKGRTLFRQTGGLLLGRPDGEIVTGALRSAWQHGLKHEVLSRFRILSRYPGFQPDGDMIGVFEPRAGFLFPEACVETHLELAHRHGADLHFDEPALRWEPEGRGVRVVTEKATYSAGQLLITAGPWAKSLLPDLNLPLSVERQVLFWFEPLNLPALFWPDRCPIYIWETGPGKYFYGFPDAGTGVKVAFHHQGEIVQPDAVRREVAPEETERMRGLLAHYMPLANGRLRDTAVCLYTNTPDSHFLIDRHPAHQQVLIASPCSGHGFKFASAIGEVLADLLIAGKTSFDLSLFRLRWPVG
jgi:sarcosine oxidase